MKLDIVMTKEEIDLAEHEFVLCWRDGITSDILPNSSGYPVAPIAFGHEWKWRAICEAARQGISARQTSAAEKWGREDDEIKS